MEDNTTRVEGNDDLVWKSIVIVSLNRIYDVLCLIASGESSPEKVDELIEFHRKGMTYFPPPAMRIDDKDNTT